MSPLPIYDGMLMILVLYKHCLLATVAMSLWVNYQVMARRHHSKAPLSILWILDSSSCSSMMLLELWMG